MQNVTQTFDAALQLKSAGLVAASAAAQVGGSDKILDLGGGRVDGRAIIDVSAIEVATGDEIYTVHIQGSNSATFASGIVGLAAMELGAATPLVGDTATGAGRFELPFCTQQNGTTYRYVRAYTVVAGTIATGINYSAYVAKDD